METKEEVAKEVVADPTAATPKPDDVVRVKRANKTLQKERDDLRAQLDKINKDAELAKLSEQERMNKTLADKESEIAAAKREAAAAKAERERERLITKLVAKHKLVDPEYGDMVLKGYNPEEYEDFDAFVAEAKKKPAIAYLFKSGKERVVDEDGEDIVPKTPGGNTPAKGSNWEREQREFAKELFPHSKKDQDEYIEIQRTLRGK